MIKKFKEIKDIVKEEISKNPRLKLEIFKFNFKEKLNDLYKNMKIEYIDNNILYVSVKNTTLKHYFYSNKVKIIEEINEKIDIIIDDINIRVK